VRLNFIVTRTDEAAHRTMAGAEETDIMMAQDYQDITGQMIKQVVSVVQEIEEKLVRLVVIFGYNSETTKAEAKNGEKTHGPQLTGVDQDKVATSQSNVDDLLASLGF
jgi:chemotaxis protein CheZ